MGGFNPTCSNPSSSSSLGKVNPLPPTLNTAPKWDPVLNQGLGFRCDGFIKIRCFNHSIFLARIEQKNRWNHQIHKAGGIPINLDSIHVPPKRTLGSERGQSWWQEYHVNRALIAGSPRTKKNRPKIGFHQPQQPNFRHVRPHLLVKSKSLLLL